MVRGIRKLNPGQTGLAVLVALGMVLGTPCIAMAQTDTGRSAKCLKALSAVEREWDKLEAEQSGKRNKGAAALGKQLDELYRVGLSALRSAALAAKEKDPGEANDHPCWEGARVLDKMLTFVNNAQGLCKLAVQWGKTIDACGAVEAHTKQSPDVVCRDGVEESEDRKIGQLCRRCNEAFTALNTITRALPHFGEDMADAFEELETLLQGFVELGEGIEFGKALLAGSTRKDLLKRGRQALKQAELLRQAVMLANWAAERRDEEQELEEVDSELNAPQGISNGALRKRIARMTKLRSRAVVSCVSRKPPPEDEPEGGEASGGLTIDTSVFEKEDAEGGGDKGIQIDTSIFESESGEPGEGTAHKPGQNKKRVTRCKRSSSGNVAKSANDLLMACDIEYVDDDGDTTQAARPSKKTLTTTDIMRVVNKSKPAMRTCFKKYGKGLESATIRTKLKISGSGSVTNVGISSMEFAGTALGNCVKKVQKGMKFLAFAKPSLTKSISVRLP